MPIYSFITDQYVLQQVTKLLSKGILLDRFALANLLLLTTRFLFAGYRSSITRFWLFHFIS